MLYSFHHPSFPEESVSAATEGASVCMFMYALTVKKQQGEQTMKTLSKSSVACKLNFNLQATET